MSFSVAPWALYVPAPSPQIHKVKTGGFNFFFVFAIASSLIKLGCQILSQSIASEPYFSNLLSECQYLERLTRGEPANTIGLEVQISRLLDPAHFPDRTR